MGKGNIYNLFKDRRCSSLHEMEMDIIILLLYRPDIKAVKQEEL